MTVNIQTAPYLRQQRDFPPDDSKALAVQVDRAYVDIAASVNARTIGLFALNTAVVNGESWFLKGSSQQQQALRKVFQFSSAGSFAHGINFSGVSFISRGFGTYYDGTNYYGVIFGSSTAIAGQISFYVTPTNIVVLSGAGAPSITSGILVLEWVSNF
jgi:hypothetical protein